MTDNTGYELLQLQDTNFWKYRIWTSENTGYELLKIQDMNF